MQQPPNYRNYGGWQQPQQPNTQYPPQQFQAPPQPGYQPQYGQWQQPPMMPPVQPPPRPPKKKRSPWLIIGIIVGVLILLAAISNAVNKPSPSAQATPTTVTQATATPAPTDTPTLVPTSTPQPIHYPPTTLADLRGLAAKGDMSAIHEFHSESVGLTGACPQPKREVTVDPSVTGQQLAEDLLAYFYAQQLDSPCGSIVFAYHNQDEANDVYTAGRINFDVTDSSGAENLDPNATNLKHTLTLDIGGFSTNQEYVVTY